MRSWRVAPRRQDGEHGDDRASHARGRAMQEETNAECAESDESVASAFVFAAIMEEK